LPGHHITQQQEVLYMQSRQTGNNQSLAAAKAGISERSGRRLEKGDCVPTAPLSRTYRTRSDPLEAVWEQELLPLLEREPSLSGLTLWEYLDERYPGVYATSKLRTLQRRVKHWRATQGVAKPVIFRQSVPPGLQSFSDFTHPDTAITIAGKPYAHLLYQFRLAYSGWRSVHIVRGGESYSALADGLQNALHQLGGVPQEHRTDSLSAAYVTQADKQALTTAYEVLCQHYQMKPTVNNRGVSHENGVVETANGSLKHRIDQAIKLRGSANFSSVRAYRDFLQKIVNKLNQRSQQRLKDEQAQLQALPTHRFRDFTEFSVKVTSSSTITLKRVLYTVPSSLIGETLRVHLYHDRLEGFVAQTPVIKLPRVYPDSKTGRARCINYHHVIHALAAKPRAFRFSQLRDELLPTPQYHQLWQRANQQFEPDQACKWIVAVLRFAHDYDCESLLAQELLQATTLPNLETLQKRFIRTKQHPDIPARQPSVTSYDHLLNGQWAQAPTTQQNDQNSQNGLSTTGEAAHA